MSLILAVGHQNAVLVEEVQAILAYNSNPLKKLVSELDTKQKILNATHGRKIRSLVCLKSGAILLSSIDSYTLYERLASTRKPAKKAK